VRSSAVLLKRKLIKEISMKPGPGHPQKLRDACCYLFALAGVLFSLPLAAGVLYVPAVHEVQGNVVIRTEVWATNPSLNEVLGFYALFIPSLQDGTQRSGDRPVFFVAPGQSVRFSNLVPPNQTGMLEIEGSPNLLLSARLAVDVIDQGGEPEPEEVPMIGSGTLIPANGEAWLHGLGKQGSQRYTNVGLMNLGHQAATCTVEARRADGLLLVQNVQVSLPPLSHVQFNDAFSLLQLSAVADGAWLRWTCNQPFWAYSTIYNWDTRSTQFLQPTKQPKSSSLLKPGDEPPPSVVFELPGVYLISNANNAGWRYNMPFDRTRAFRRVVLEFDVYVAAWDPNLPNGFHCLFWLQNGLLWENNLGYLNSRGIQNEMVFQVNATGGEWIERYQAPGLELGNSYHVYYEYNTDQDYVMYEIYRGSTFIVGTVYEIDVGPIVTNYSFIEFGSQIADGPEAITPNWRFSDFRIKWYE
jgi:hypothetical protein